MMMSKRRALRKKAAKKAAEQVKVSSPEVKNSEPAKKPVSKKGK